MSLSEPAVRQFTTLFNETSPEIERLMDECYADDILFRDPLVELRGRDALAKYLSNAYAGVTRCEFDFGQTARCSGHLTLPWTMTLEHRKLARGRPIMVDGITLLQGENDLIRYHRDYYDAGQLVYENLPLVGAGIRWLRRQAA